MHLVDVLVKRTVVKSSMSKVVEEILENEKDSDLECHELQ